MNSAAVVMSWATAAGVGPHGEVPAGDPEVVASMHWRTGARRRAGWPHRSRRQGTRSAGLPGRDAHPRPQGTSAASACWTTNSALNTGRVHVSGKWAPKSTSGSRRGTQLVDAQVGQPGSAGPGSAGHGLSSPSSSPNAAMYTSQETGRVGTQRGHDLACLRSAERAAAWAPAKKFGTADITPGAKVAAATVHDLQPRRRDPHHPPGRPRRQLARRRTASQGALLVAIDFADITLA